MAKSSSTHNSLHQVPSSSQRSCGRGGSGNGSDIDQSPEESGWTIYFEDFLNSNHHPDDHELSSFSSDHVAPDGHTYAVADAASSVVGDNDVVGAAVAPGLSCKDVNGFKKRKMIKELFVEDESLEDTASSPVNSPKVSDSTYFSKNQKHKVNLVTPQVEERSREMGFVGMGSDFTQLKKRGLCLVPLSMVVNYLAE